MAEHEKTIRLDVITPDAAVLNEDVEFVLVRALDGDLGILPNHAPLIASLYLALVLRQGRKAVLPQRRLGIFGSQRQYDHGHRAGCRKTRRYRRSPGQSGAKAR